MQPFYRIILYFMVFVLLMTLAITSHLERMKKLDGRIYASQLTESVDAKKPFWK